MLSVRVMKIKCRSLNTHTHVHPHTHTGTHSQHRHSNNSSCCYGYSSSKYVEKISFHADRPDIMWFTQSLQSHSSLNSEKSQASENTLALRCEVSRSSDVKSEIYPSPCCFAFFAFNCFSSNELQSLALTKAVNIKTGRGFGRRAQLRSYVRSTKLLPRSQDCVNASGTLTHTQTRPIRFNDS